jgi:hypothetical protein
MLTVQVPVPAQAPDQPANVEPPPAVAVSVTPVPARYASLQSSPQLMPDGLLLTVPLPLPAGVTVSMSAARAATATFNLIPDTTPEAFGFAPQASVTPGATVTSTPLTPTGYNTAAPISVANGEYSIGCNGLFTGSAGSISPGQSVCVRHTASANPGSTVTTRSPSAA